MASDEDPNARSGGGDDEKVTQKDAKRRQQPQIRHAGRAHVRGKIRRIWRPRYLELFDNGLVRYYELPAASADISQQQQRDNDWDLVDRIPKYALAVFGARILDVTTLRDMHVGLPHGAFGFLFRGQRLLHLERQYNDDDDDDAYETGAASAAASSSSAPFTVNPLPHTTPSAMSIAATAMSMQHACGGGGAGRPEPPKQEQQRDFLCAVSSLEEAQMWVVALQWAASYRQRHPSMSIPTEPWWNNSVEGVGRTPSGLVEEDRSVPVAASASGDFDNHEMVMVRDEEGVDAGGADVGRKGDGAVAAADRIDSTETDALQTQILRRRHPPSSSDEEGQQQRKPVVKEHSVGAETPAVKSETAKDAATKSEVSKATGGKVGAHRRRMHHHRTSLGGKVVVSKVVAYRVVRVSGLQFEVAYEIHGMLLRRRVAEQWSMLRTAEDIQNLIGDLTKELGPSLLDRAQLGLIRRLPRLSQKPQPTALTQSLSVVDSILRSFVMDAAMVNTNAMKAFLGLSSSQHAVSPKASSSSWKTVKVSNSSSISQTLRQWWSAHDAVSVLSRTTESLPEHVTTDHYVKSWLQARPPPSAMDTCVVIAWRRPLVVLGAAGVSAIAVVPLADKWQQIVPRVTMRFDTLVLSWIGAAYVGRCYYATIDDTLAVSGSEGVGRSHRSKTSLSEPSALPSGSSRNVTHGATVADAFQRTGSELDHGAVAPAPPKGDEDDLISVADSSADEDSDGEEMTGDEDESETQHQLLSSPLPEYPDNGGVSCWSKPEDDIFHVRGVNYFSDRIKIPSEPSPLTCRGVDIWITDNPERNISKHPAVLGGMLGDEDTFLVNFLLPFGNFVAYFSVPPLNKFPRKLRNGT